MRSETAAIRHFLLQYFDDDELSTLAFDYFPDVYRDFSSGMAKSRKAQLLLKYGLTHGKMPLLLQALQTERPSQYQSHLGALSWPSDQLPSAKSGSRWQSTSPGHRMLGVGILVAITAVVFLLIQQFQPFSTSPPEPTGPVMTNASSTTSSLPVSSPVATSNGGGGSIGLDETVAGQLANSQSETWTYSGPAAEVDIYSQGGARDDLIVLVFDAGGQQRDYIDGTREGQGELRTFFQIQPGDEIVVDSPSKQLVEYTLTVQQSVPTPIGLGETATGNLLADNFGVYVFDQGPATVDIELEMGQQDAPLLLLFDPEGSQLEYLTQRDASGSISLSNYALEAGPHRLAVRDQNNDGADFRLTVRSAVE